MANNSFDWLAYFALDTLKNVGLKGLSRLLYAKIIWNKLELDEKSSGNGKLINNSFNFFTAKVTSDKDADLTSTVGIDNLISFL